MDVSNRSADSPESPFDKVQSYCKEYRRRLKQGDDVAIEQFLKPVDESARQLLFQNLLEIDVNFRRHKGETPSSNDYVTRFPQFRRQIRHAFFESTMLSMAEDVSTNFESDRFDVTIELPSPAARQLGEYELIREVGRGGFGVVYEARHRQRSERVALKTIATAHLEASHQKNQAEYLHRFRREFRTLSEVNHPNLVGMQSFAVEGGQWFITMDYVDGTDFLDWVRPNGACDERRLRTASAQLAKGILALHETNILHCDLKPSNVLVNSDGQVQILDFGLVTELQVANDKTMTFAAGQFAGTPRYAAPEQISGTHTAATDWYAFGVMLYEALTGEPPYTGNHIELLHKKQSEDAPLLLSREEIPPDLGELVDGLLVREPSQRTSPKEIVDVLGIQFGSESRGSISESSLSPTTQSHTLVGREDHLETLHEAALRTIEERCVQAAFVHGLSGEGKTSLIAAALEPLRARNDVLVLSGRCYDRESVPYKAADCLIDALVRYLRSCSESELSRLIPDDIRLLAHLFPLLRRVEAIAAKSTNQIDHLDADGIRDRAFAVLRQLLKNLSSQLAIVLFIDDLQWGDADSANGLHSCIANPDAPAVLMIGSYRTDEANGSSFLRRWRELQDRDSLPIEESDIQVGPLSWEDSLQIALNRIDAEDGFGEEAIRECFDHSNGNPYLFEQLLDSLLVSSGQSTGRRIHDIVAAKLERLPEGSNALLHSVAVAGQATRVGEIALISEQSDRALNVLTHMRNERLVRLIDSGGDEILVDTYHDQIREAVTDGLPTEELRRLHLQFGELIEKSVEISGRTLLKSMVDEDKASDLEPLPSRLHDLAYHFHEADDERAFVYQMLAGEQAMNAYASEAAVAHFENARNRLPDNASRRTRFRLWYGLGETHRRLARNKLAIELLDKGFEYAESRLDRSRVKECLGLAYVVTDDSLQAVACFDQALEEIGRHRAKGFFGQLWQTNTTVLRLWLLPRKIQESKTEQKKLESIQATRIYYWSMHELVEINMLSATVVALRGALEAKCSGHDETASAGYMKCAGILGCFGTPYFPKVYAMRSNRIGRPTEPNTNLGMYLFGEAVMRNMSDTPYDSLTCFEDSYQIMNRIGDTAHSIAALHFKRHTLTFFGTASEEADTARRELAKVTLSGSSRMAAWGNYGIASGEARAGNLDSANEHIQRADELLKNRRILTTRVAYLSTVGFVCIQNSEYERAIEALSECLKRVQEGWLFLAFSVWSLPLLIEAHCGPNWNSSQKRPDKRLAGLCRKAKVFRSVFPELEVHITRVLARADYLYGRSQKALKRLGKAEAVARKKKLDYLLARVLLDTAAIDSNREDALRAEGIQLLKASDSVIPYAERWQLGDDPDPACFAADRSKKLLNGSSD